ncbi:MAG: hypothetical protein HYZ11_09860 [Candidatus Tectomicrobia bacterium]|uniref:Uncharacterized protein n=1 Tax=Tectimicrobiota bacterium TaxID=2528274 RepID=A0A932HZ14_UNCTE|nr:hypothetical protein [Candidatus Tectomicrobia bacterium]
MLSRYDRIVFSLIALALAVIAMNPWVAPGYVSAQGGKVDVNVVEFAGTLFSEPNVKGRLPGIPVIILNK